MQFWLWPSSTQNDPRDAGTRFFDVIDEIGTTVYSDIVIDGGAGV